VKKIIAILVVLFIGVLPATAVAHSKGDHLRLSFAKAPIVPDGTTAGAPTDFVIAFAKANPAIDGVALKSGATIKIKLDSAFDLSGNQGSSVGPPAIILQGWPQSPRVPFPYTTDVDGNTIRLTLTDDWDVGDFGPGPKAVHLDLRASTNPTHPGRYKVEVEIQPDPESSDTIKGKRRIKIIRDVRASVNVVSVFSGPPGPPPPFFNPLYQDVELGESGRQIGMQLWEFGGAPAVGVDIVMVRPWWGRLMQDGHKVGWVYIKAPKGARGQTLVSTEPSVEAPSAVSGILTGRLISTFTPDPSVPGEYKVVFGMERGNKQVMRYSVSD